MPDVFLHHCCKNTKALDKCNSVAKKNEFARSYRKGMKNGRRACMPLLFCKSMVKR